MAKTFGAGLTMAMRSGWRAAGRKLGGGGGGGCGGCGGGCGGGGGGTGGDHSGWGGCKLRCSGQRRHAGAPAFASPDGPTGSVAPSVCARVFKERRDELRARSSYIYI